MTIATLLSPFPSQANQRHVPAHSDISQKEKPVYGGTLIMGTANPPTIINPILTTHSVSATIIPLVFNGLVRLNSKGKIESSLAERWDVSENHTEYTFYLKKNIRFHDDVELTASDVKFTYTKIMDVAVNSPYIFHFDLVKEIIIVDDYTVCFILTKPFTDFLYQMVRYIVPEHIYSQDNIGEGVFNWDPIGTGPFRFHSWDQKNDQILLIANKDYFEGRPYLDEIQIKVFQNISLLWSAFMRQEIHLAKFINPEDFELLKEDPAFKTYEQNWGMYYALVYDLSYPALGNEATRKALSLAIDIEELIKKNLHGGGIPAGSLFQQDLKENNLNRIFLKYNPKRSVAILKERGWEDQNNDGLLEKDDSVFEIQLLVNSRIKEREKIATIVRQQLARVGIKSTIVLYQPENFPEKTDIPRAWLRLFRGIDASDGYDAIKSWYSLSTEAGGVLGYRNDRVDRLFEKAKIEQDQEKRTRIYQTIDSIIYQDQPATLLFFPVSLHAVSANFRNTDEYFSPHMPTYTIKDWYIFMN